jgi:prevent-host-death family protein
LNTFEIFPGNYQEGVAMENRVGATDLRQHLTDVLQAVREQRETYVIETFGRPQAAIINLDEYEQFLRYQHERAAFFEWLDQAATENAEQNAGLSEQETSNIVALAREQVTDERRPGDRRPTADETVKESRAFYSTDRMVVGKLAWASDEGQLSVFPLPADLSWIRQFSDKYLAEFLTELLAALPQAQQSGDWSTIDEVLASWKATAEIEADPALSEAVDEGLIELQEGRSTTWSDLRRELDL